MGGARPSRTSASGGGADKIRHDDFVLSSHDERAAAGYVDVATLSAGSGIAVLGPFPLVAVQVLDPCRCVGKCATWAQGASGLVCLDKMGGCPGQRGIGKDRNRLFGHGIGCKLMPVGRRG